MFGTQDPTQSAQGGLMGLLNSPAGQGLLAAGLGAMGSRGSTMQAIGRGGLLGMSTFGQAQDTRRNRLLDAAKLKAKQDALAGMTPGQDGTINATPAQYEAAGFTDPSKWGYIRNMGRDKFKEMQKVTNADGSQSIHSVNEYGGIQNTGLTNAAEIKAQDLGGQVSGINPYTGQQAWAANKSATIGEIERARSNRASEGLTARGQNMADARAREANALTLSKPFEVTGEDGRPMLVQQDKAGNIRPVQGFQPKTGADKALTEGQSKAVLFGSRMQASNNILDQLATKGVTTSIPGSTAGWGIGAVVNAGSSAEHQQLDQAKRDFINATLRRESGAAIAESEFNNAEKQYFPQIGDTPQVKAQKAANRAIAVRGMQAEIPAAHRSLVGDVIGGGKTPAPAALERQVIRSGVMNGRKVVQYSDGKTEYAD